MKLLNIIIDMFCYIFNLRISDIPLHIAYVGVIAVIGYSVSMMIIGIPCAIYKSITKKYIADEIQNKIICIVAIFLDVILGVILLYELTIEK